MNTFSAQRPFLCDFESLGDYHDFWCNVIHSAPDELTYSFLEDPIDQGQALIDAFDSLHRGLTLAKKRLKDERHYRIAEELLRMSFEFYSTGARKQGVASLQEAEGLIWPSRSIKPNLVAEAERRAFGIAVLFANVKPRRYDCEVTLNELGEGQRSLFEAALARTVRAIEEGQESCTFFLARMTTGEIVEVKKPSQKKTLEEIRRRVTDAEVVAVVRAEMAFLSLLVLDMEERNQPLVSARALLKDGKVQAFRFFLDDPSIFPLGDD